MATPAKSVQARDAATVIEMYERMNIPAWAIRHGAAQPAKYSGELIKEGKQQLEWWLDKLEESESAAIYQLCVFENPVKGIKDNTPADCSINFRFQDTTSSYLPGELYKGGYGSILGAIKDLRQEMADFKKEKDAEPESQLGVVGEILEMEAVQPILMALGTRIADWAMGTDKVGELKRVSGIPGVNVAEAPAPAGNWLEDPAIIAAINRLAVRVTDLPMLLTKLADLAEHRPTQFAIYATVLRKMK